MKRRWKKADEYKIYKTTYEDGTYYIGKWSSNSKVPYAEYFGSIKTDKMPTAKETLYETNKATQATLMELLLQLQSKDDSKCLNLMWNIRIRKDHIKDFPKFTIKFDD